MREVHYELRQLTQAAKGDDLDAICKSIENVMTSSQEIGKIMYEEGAKAQAAAGGPEAAAGQGPEPPQAEPTDQGGQAKKKDDDVIDAEFEVKE